jgi:hypothetical protein
MKRIYTLTIQADKAIITLADEHVLSEGLPLEIKVQH